MNRRFGPYVFVVALATTARTALAQPSSSPDAQRADVADAPGAKTSSDTGANALPPSEPAPGQAPAPASPAAEPVEIRVRGDGLRLDQKRRSAEAVDILDVERARRSSADLGDVVSRATGVTVQRTAGLGSPARLSLNGLTDDQIRYFLDGVPLDFMGFSTGIANVPVNMIESIEIYRGVVPIRFGADALGGAINLVTDQSRKGTRAAASYEVGSFGTYRLTLSGRHRTESGWFASVSSFVDRAKNNYPVNVAVADAQGQLQPVTVRRFHDGYRAGGVNAEFGIADQSWAKQLSVRLFATSSEKELQNNVLMRVPYGEVESGETIYGATLNYVKNDFLVPKLRFQALTGYSRRDIEFRDDSTWVYDWYGRRIFQRKQPIGELGSVVSDATYWENRALGRMVLGYPIGDGQSVRVAVAPTYTTRTGKENLPHTGERLDKLSAEQRLAMVVTGAEYQLDALEGVLENIAFVKDYVYAANAQNLAEDGRSFLPVRKNEHRLGAGNGLRVRFGESVWAKASYEYATRLPRTDEVFGDGVMVLPNLDLRPETSHNLNVGVTVDAKHTPLGAFRGETTGFLRAADDLIVFMALGRDAYSVYDNVAKARSLGVQGGAGWTSPGDYLWLDANATWMDFRNTSDTGYFAPYKGDRVPNRPWLFANASARLQFSNVQTKNDELSFEWGVRYVHSFYPSWESVGQRDTKVVVPQQIVQSARIGYVVRAALKVTSSLEVQNLTDARVYDVVGIQKPGRAFYFKGTIEY